MPLFAVHVNFVEQREGDVVFAGAELLDLFVRARFLSAELVARETEHGETLVFVFLLEGFEGLVLRRKAALGGDVDDEEHLAFVGAQ